MDVASRVPMVPLGDRLEHRLQPNVLLRRSVHCRVRLKQLVDRIGRRRTDAYDGVESTANGCCLARADGAGHAQ
jgi:hypothetical protein